jgi:HAD superfamily hydrolase (TIGR01509 family)
MTPSAVIFDVDGTLVDSNDAHAEAWVRAFAECEHPVDRSAVRRSIGMGGDKLMPAVSGIDAESDLGRRISTTRSAIFARDYLPGLTAFPRAAELVSTLRDRGFALAVASSAKREELEEMLTLIGLDALLPKKIAGDEVDESKPEPDVILAALGRLHVSPPEAIMIGDTPYDVEAAQAAGVPCIAFRSGGWRDSDLVGAVAIYHGTAHLLARLESSPLQVSYATR